LANTTGNNSVDKQLRRSTDLRDALLAFAGTRLKTLFQVQQKELKEIKDQRQWFKEVAKGVAGFHLPDPTRWHQSAELYQQAATALANGNLGKGGQLLDKALEAERAAYKSMPVQVEQELNRAEQTQPQTPHELAHVSVSSVCPSTKRPTEIKYADLILNVMDVMEGSSPNPLMRQWWESEEEEEEEEEEEAAT
jgi:hypothetical protein